MKDIVTTLLNRFSLILTMLLTCRRGGAVVSALDVRSEGCWFDAQSLPSCCFLRQETLPRIVFLHPGV